jgi:16S rRNA (cytosine967-C5)-methyltransferase
MNARAVALTALREWRRGRQFADTIIQGLLAESTLQGSDRGFATELFYGVLRNLSLLDFWTDMLRSGPLDHASRDVLRLGFYQIFLLQTPQHAAVFETVELSGRRNRGLINGVLRAALRREKELRTAAESAPLSIRFSHPEFLIERWKNNFGADNATLLCQWNNQPAPIYARVNRLRNERKEKFLRLNEISTDAIARGEYYIQDPSTAVACELLDPQPNETILDACAAPGGKSAYIAELMANSGTLFACDRDSPRINLLNENLKRLGVANTTVVRQDWKDSSIAPELRDRKFDRVLVDAPCTNTGVMRRRVDVRWRLRPEDFTRMPEQQLVILRAVLPFLKSGGALVYSTCSIEAEENELVVRHLLEKFPNLRLEETRSILPWRDDLDGAFAAKFLHS